MLVAVGLRLAIYLGRPTLWLDEARIALNVGSRSWGGLLRPLDYDQTAPPLFLWLEKLAISVGGANELALRAPPLLAGVLSVTLLYWLARRVLDERGAAIAAAVGALSPLLLEYSNEVKPYAFDLLTALVLLHLGLRWSDRPASLKRAWVMAAAGVISMALSTPAVFVLAGIGLALWWAPESVRPPRHRLAAAIGVGAATFGAIYVAIYRPAALNPYMQQYWETSMLRLGHPQWLGHAWALVRDVVWQTFSGPASAVSPAERWLVQLGAAFALACCAVGLVLLAKQGERRLVIMLLVPAALAVIGAMLGAYPIAARLLLFTVPSLIIPLVVALSNLPVRIAGDGRRAFGGLLGLIVLIPPLSRAASFANRPAFA
jgi:4-amino-4-deoxy-L-arabinose transferase-like glycosyltransferase